MKKRSLLLGTALLCAALWSVPVAAAESTASSIDETVVVSEETSPEAKEEIAVAEPDQTDSTASDPQDKDTTKEPTKEPVGEVLMYRLYNPNSGEHFYTGSAGEKEHLYSVGWNYEGVGFVAPETSASPVYRLYNPNAGDHHYTTSSGERDALVRVGWSDEGIGWYSDTKERVFVYREYNPNAKAGAHNFTTSRGEHDGLVRIGWRGEGTAFYAVREGYSVAPTRYHGTELRDIYDYDYYLKANPDVAAAVGTDGNRVLEHFVKYGLKENRIAKASYSQAKYDELKKHFKAKIVCIDPGHQLKGMSQKEPNAPGSSVQKAKVTSGTYGRWSRKNEYEVNLDVALKLKEELLKRGYEVVMTRETHNVSISNVERAQVANNAHADLFIRIHCNGIDSQSANGVLAYVPTAHNRYLGSNIAGKSRTLGQLIVNGQCAATGQDNLGILAGDDMTGINWAKMPVAILEMGFMSNPTEDRRLADGNFQNRIVQGVANGIDQYVSQNP